MWAYRPYKNPDGSFNWASYYRDQEFIKYCEDTKGKNFPVYDDLTLKEIPQEEVIAMELEREHNTRGLYIPISEDGNYNTPTIKVKSTRKYKTRIRVSKLLRQAVYELYDYKCATCKKPDPNQIHHIDSDPSNNNIKNLYPLCYDCHLEIELKLRNEQKIF